MKLKEELLYFKDEWTNLRSHLKAFDKKGKQEDLHRFRVQVKKLRAFLILADSGLPVKQLEKELKPVRKLFKAAGEIRNAYINLELTKQFLIAQPEMMEGQRKLMKQSAHDFRSEASKHLQRLRWARRKLKKVIPKISDIHIDFYYRQQLEQLAVCLAPPYADTALHACRKQLKMLIYNYKLVKPVLNQPFNIAYLDEVQDIIGEWHDKEVAIALFATGEAENEQLVDALKKEKTRLKRHLTSLVKDFYTRATTVNDLPLAQID
ncbi:CHAD domain-containing protein [Mucilaginibacter kameinonensis]|uniref:CHAD domain-containing protein n=1 Tax=Mucilaginibacter kameinonensis TaxID=452286 RepID=UPI000EF7AA92|nr:CHAD domain-containing protein [Mucilaginibacter kameinonensis]